MHRSCMCAAQLPRAAIKLLDACTHISGLGGCCGLLHLAAHAVVQLLHVLAQQLGQAGRHGGQAELVLWA